MGTVAGNITQTVSFYNTTGVIEKEHNLYYCPKSSNNTNIALEWLRLFETVATKRSDYTNVVISQWSPEDRTLTIEGRIEHFRYRNSSKTINYMIVTEVITGSSIYDPYVEVYRTGYFITGARQNGVNSVTLDVEPDHFTNTFYLHNSVVGYLNDNIFRNVLKNTYVERQHYDRVSITEGSNYYYVDDAVVSGTGLTINRTLTKYNSNKIVRVKVTTVTDENYETIPNVVQVGSIINSQTDDTISVLIVVNLPEGYSGQTVHVTLTAYYIESIEQLNLPLFANYEETFRYRRQVRDYHEMLNYGYPTSKEEIKQLVNNYPAWSSFTEAEKITILNYCLSFATCTFKGYSCLLGYVSATGADDEDPVKVMPKTKPITLDNLVTLTVPVAVIPDELLYYTDNINEAFSFIKLGILGGKIIRNNFSKILETNIFSEEIVSLSITKEHVLYDYLSWETVTLENKQVIISSISCKYTSAETPQIACFYAGKDVEIGYQTLKLNEVIKKRYLGFNFVTSVLVAGADEIVPRATLQVVEDYTQAIAEEMTNLVSQHWEIELPVAGFICSEINMNKTVYLNNNVKDTSSQYYEPILEFNPYSFYSISYLGKIEVPLNLRNYLENYKPERNQYEIKFNQIVSISDTTKYTFLPSYIINGKETKYYSESLEVTTPNHLTILSDVMINYIAQNSAQMKNQYAVNEQELGKGMLKGAVGGLTTGLSAGMMTGNPVIGLGAGLIGLGAGSIGSTITYAFNEQEIQLNQKAKLADLGTLPNNVKQVGTDMPTDLSIAELGLYLNHYNIDEISYNNICKYLERYGYLINIYDVVNIYNRKGWNYVKLIDMEFNIGISEEAEESIRQIFNNGVTLLHIPSYLHNDSVHNYESSIER